MSWGLKQTHETDMSYDFRLKFQLDFNIHALRQSRHEAGVDTFAVLLNEWLQHYGKISLRFVVCISK